MANDSAPGRLLRGIAIAMLIILSQITGIFCQDSTASEQESRADYPAASVQRYRISPAMDFIYAKPRPFGFFTNGFKDIARYGKTTFRTVNIPQWTAVLASTALLVAIDQPIIDESQRLGTRLHISGDIKNRNIAHVFGFPIYIPANTGSALYYLGDGFLDVVITASFFGYGLIGSNNRALETSSQLAEGLISVAVVIQTLKHITGRQSPSSATVPAGVWRPFPNQVEYHKHVSSYDAYPSGHLATAMMVVTVISENYPEHRYIQPLGYSLMTVLAFQMLNNGVHWASDYPLALAIGYTMGKIAASRIHRVTRPQQIPGDPAGRKTERVQLYPFFNGREALGIGIGYAF